MYYRDLELIGTVLRDNSRDSLVSYIRVYDLGGNLVHDGSVEIQGYGLPMGDPLAAAAVAAKGVSIQESPAVLEASAPILVGSERIGGVRVGLDLQVAGVTRTGTCPSCASAWTNWAAATSAGWRCR